jgi:tetratricopeptide (TPR) repeat protein
VRFFCSLAVLLAALQGTARTAAAPTAAGLRKQAFDLAYNLDHDEAIALFEKARALAPDDPASHRALAAVIWLHLLFQRGAITVDHYLGSISRPRADVRQPDAGADKDFHESLERALSLASRRVSAAPRDPQAQYDFGTALGLQASYAATVEGKLLAGFRTAKRAFDAHEEVLELDPRRKDAGLVVGTYRYVVSDLPLPMRWMAYVAGFGGGRERGLRLIEDAAAFPGDSQVEARFALVLIYNRERRYASAMGVLNALERQFPRNRLILLEKGSTELRAGRYAEADRYLTEGLARLAQDRRRRMPGEEALWRCKRGTARLASGRREEAVADLRAALAAGPAEWVAGRTRLELGKASDSIRNVDGARAEYQQAITLCERGNDPACVEEARKRLSEGQRTKGKG